MTVHNKTGDIGIAYADAGLIELPDGKRAVAAFMVKGPFNDPRSTNLIRAMAGEIAKSLVRKPAPASPRNPPPKELAMLPVSSPSAQPLPQFCARKRSARCQEASMGS